LAVDPGRNDVVQLELKPTPPPRLIALAWRRDREQTEVVRELIQVTTDVCADMFRRQ
jgi:hypothetical protein